MSDMDQIHRQLADIRETLGDVGATVKSILDEAKKTNGRVTKNEDWQKAHDLAAAGSEGLRLGRAEAFITRKQMAFAVATIGALAGTITSVVTLIVRVL